MKLNEVSRSFQLKHWAELVYECRNSGKTIATWCAENEINRNTYYYWLRQLRIAACDALPAMAEKINPLVPVPFEMPELSTTANEPESGITLRIGSATLELHNGMSSELLSAALKALNYVR